MKSWTLYNLRGPRDQVKATVTAADKIPETDRAYMISRIDDLPPECFAAKVSAYCQTHTVGSDIVTNLNITITGLK
jgi:hypothetical protein